MLLRFFSTPFIIQIHHRRLVLDFAHFDWRVSIHKNMCFHKNSVSTKIGVCILNLLQTHRLEEQSPK